MYDTAAADILVENLVEQGVDTVIGIPGDGIDVIIESLRKRQDDIRFVQVRHEEAAALAASGYAKWTGKLGAGLATSGSGGIHLHDGVLDARLDGQSVLAITGMQFHDLLHTHTKQDGKLDELFMDLNVYISRIKSPNRAGNAVELARGSALDLCLSCTACNSSCPVNADMATDKADFRSRHDTSRKRPFAAHTMGRIHQWARIGGAVPGLANFATRTPGLSVLAKWAGSISPQHEIPRFSAPSFTQWFRQREDTSAAYKKVVLWPDTFNNYFRADTAIAATHLLEHLGYDVVIPEGHVCCGRPLYDRGLRDEAKALWQRNFAVLENEIRDGTPIIGLEPGCVSAFRDELPKLLPGNEQAEKLSSQTRFITEFLEHEDVDLSRAMTASGKNAPVQMHCHEHATLDSGTDTKVLDRAGIPHEILNSWCCGVAGSIRFEKDISEVSQAAGEWMLLPREREESDEAPILANGFSCREQIELNTGRNTLHVADLLARAILPQHRR